MMRLLLLAAMLALPGIAAAQPAGPSFDCARARAWDERTICNQADLSELDRRIAAAWRRLLDQAAPDQRTLLLSEQRAWLGQRRSCQGAVEREAQSCLRRILRARARDLEAAARDPATPPATAAAPAVAAPALRAVACPSTAGWAARTICATPGLRALDAAIVRDIDAAWARAEGQPALRTDIAAFVTLYGREREACGSAAGRIPVDCLQETMEEAQTALRRHLNRG